MDTSAEFQQLVLKYLDSLYNYGRILTRNEAEAEDLLQETLLRALRGATSLNPTLNAKAWLLKIMKNTHIDRCRRKLSRPTEGEFEDGQRLADRSAEEGILNPVPLDPEEILLRRLAIEDVRGAIRRLPCVWREAVELRDIEGLSYQEIARVIQRPIGTVMSRLYRGRNLLRSLLQGSPDHETKPERVSGL